MKPSYLFLDIDGVLNDVLNDLEPYYDGIDFCDGFSDYIDHFTKNKELIISHLKRKGVVNEI